MPFYSYLIEASDDGETWWPEFDDSRGTEVSGHAPAELARIILATRLHDVPADEDPGYLRVLVWAGGEEGDEADAAAVVASVAGHTRGFEITRWVPCQPDAVDAVQLTVDNFAEAAAWAAAITYTGDRHGHTTPPWQFHTCMTTDEGPSVGPGDWVIRLGDGFRGVPAAEFTAGYTPAVEED